MKHKCFPRSHDSGTGVLRCPNPQPLQLYRDWALREWSTELPVGQVSSLSQMPLPYILYSCSLFKEEKWVNSFHLISFLPSFLSQGLTHKDTAQESDQQAADTFKNSFTSVKLQDAPLTPKRSWRSNVFKFPSVQMVIYSCDANRSWAWGLLKERS